MVSEQFEARESVALQLSCPSQMVADEGAEHECEGTTANGEDVEILISVVEEGSCIWAED